MTGCDGVAVKSALVAAGRAVIASRDELTELDRAIGDGDHGENLRRGFEAFESAVDTPEAGNPATVCTLLAKTLISTVGGAAGPLYGTAFLRASSAMGDGAELTDEPVAAALRAALDGVRARGKAEPGDKTMVDALDPAVSAAESARGRGVPALLAAAAEAAQQGAEATRNLPARKGRASYLGERSTGHIDPGARSTALLLSALAAHSAGS